MGIGITLAGLSGITLVGVVGLLSEWGVHYIKVLICEIELADTRRADERPKIKSLCRLLGQPLLLAARLGQISYSPQNNREHAVNSETYVLLGLLVLCYF